LRIFTSFVIDPNSELMHRDRMHDVAWRCPFL
jgi:hypothetical protein